MAIDIATLCFFCIVDMSVFPNDWELLEVKSCCSQLWSLAYCLGCDLLPAYLFSRLSCCQRYFSKMLLSLYILPDQNIVYTVSLACGCHIISSLIQTRESSCCRIFLTPQFAPLRPLYFGGFIFYTFKHFHYLFHIISYFSVVSLSFDQISNALTCVVLCCYCYNLLQISDTQSFFPSICI